MGCPRPEVQALERGRWLGGGLDGRDDPFPETNEFGPEKDHGDDEHNRDQADDQPVLDQPLAVIRPLFGGVEAHEGLQKLNHDHLL